MLSMFLVNARALNSAIGRMNYDFSRTPSMPLEKGSSISATIIFILRPILLSNMLGTKEIRNQLGFIAHMLDV